MADRPSVYPIDLQQQRRAAGLLLIALRAGDIDRQLRARYGRRAAGIGAQQQRRRSTALSSKRGLHHADSQSMKLNTDLFYQQQFCQKNYKNRLMYRHVEVTAG